MAPTLHQLDSSDGPTGPASQVVTNAILGPVLLGDCCELVVYGLLLAAVFSFYNSPSRARTSLGSSALIMFVVALTTLSTALDIGDIWHYGTLQDRTEGGLLTGTLVEACEPLFVGMVGAIVESVLVYRASRMFTSKLPKWCFVLFAGMLITTGFLGSIGATVWGVMYFVQPFLNTSFQPSFNQCVAAWLGNAAAADLLITTTFVVQIRKRFQQTGFNKSTDSALALVIRLAIQSAAYTTILAVPGAILSIVFNGDSLLTTDIAYSFWLPLPGLYALSLFTTLSTPDRVERRLRTGNSTVVGGLRSPISPTPSSASHTRKRSSTFSPIPRSLRWSGRTKRKSSGERRESGGAVSTSAADGVSVQVDFHWISEEHEPDQELVEVRSREDEEMGMKRDVGSASQVAPGRIYLCPE